MEHKKTTNYEKRITNNDVRLDTSGRRYFEAWLAELFNTDCLSAGLTTNDSILVHGLNAWVCLEKNTDGEE